MADKEYVVEGRQFRTGSDYRLAMRDKELMDTLRSRYDTGDAEQLVRLAQDLRAGKYRFQTLLGQDFADEIEEKLKEARKSAADAGKKSKGSKSAGSPAGPSSKAAGSAKKLSDAALEQLARQELQRKERNRRRILAGSVILALLCFGYFGFYQYQGYRHSQDYARMDKLKEMPVMTPQPTATPYQVHLTGKEPVVREVLSEYQNLLNQNKKLIGWIKIADTNIDYPVVQTDDNEYYLTHNMNQEKDRNGTIFLDKDCDIVEPSTNYILYGHHMKSGKMFGSLSKYESESFYREHKYIQFDTIYEKGTYEVMYVFRSRVYSEEDVVFKYYQFIDAQSEMEFDSYMEEMKAQSFYDTGVTARFGDHLLTLSTCDYEEKNGRFVVVAKRIAKE